MKYLTVDGMLGGAGVRDQIEGGYIDPEDLNLSSELIEVIRNWVTRYETAHYRQFSDQQEVTKLDEEGLLICSRLHEELDDTNIEYFSTGLMTSIRVNF